MADSGLPLEDVVNLPHYGKHFPFLPWSFRSRVRVSLVFAGELVREFGWVEFSVLFALLPLRAPGVYRTYRQGFQLMRAKFGVMAQIEWILLVVIYQRLEATRGEQVAYRFAKNALQEASTFMMNEFYQADRLARFADPFEAFWQYHRAMFSGDPNYPNEFIETPDVRTMIVRECRNCEIANATIPALAKLGCDHDITGYPSIEDKVNMEFRRPQTLAKDGVPCRFVFYRKGTAPNDGAENH